MKTTKILAIAMAGFAVMACNKNDGVDGPSLNDGANVTITLSDNVTRALTGGSQDGTASENTVNSVEFYVFDASGTPDAEVANSSNAATTAAGYAKFASFPKPARLRVSQGTMTFVVLTNMNVGAATSYADLQAKLATAAFKATLGQSDHNSRTIPATGLEMAGEVANRAITSGTNAVTIYVSRLVSRFETPTFTLNAGKVPVTLPAEDLEELWPGESIVNADLTFTYEGFAMVNGLDKSTAMLVVNATNDDTNPVSAPWTLWSRTGKANLTSSFNGAKFYTNTYSGSVGGEWFIPTTDTDPVYAYESKPVPDAQGNYEYNTVYCFIIKGTFTVAGQDATYDRTRYWRVNLTYDDDYHILRNCVYKTTINLIKTAGYGTPQEAEEGGGNIPPKGATSVDVTVNVLKWRINSYQDEM